MTKEELAGRFMLWETAVSQAQRNLITAKRALEGANQNFQKEEQEDYQNRFKDFKRSRKDNIEGSATSTQRNDFEKVYTRSFPYLAECYSIHQACLEVAIIYFCQIFNVGYGSNTAAKNTKQFREDHLDSILSLVFPSVKELEKFNDLLDILKTVRDKMIGHADADAFNIKHGDFVTTMGGPQNITQNIEIDYWLSFMETLRIAILKYSNDVKNNI